MSSPEAELTEYLHRHIPLTASMELVVRKVEPLRVILSARLEPNLNHEQTAFGGSISAVAMMAGWSILRQRFFGEPEVPTLVVHRSESRFEKPVTADFEAYVTDMTEEKWDEFRTCLERHGKARIELNSVVTCNDQICARLVGRYVALSSEDD